MTRPSTLRRPRGRWFIVAFGVAALGFIPAGITPAAAHDEASSVDLKRLPLGDLRLAQAPKKGWIWACRTDSGGGGAGVDGPWIKADGTFDFTEKATVSGSVSWPHQFEVAIEGGARIFTWNDLPDHPTGVFPVAPNDPAYRYDRNPNHIAAQKMRVELLVVPTLLGQPTCAPGAVGILLSGAVLFNALDAMGRDAVAHEVQDSCQGHPQRSATYHYHSLTNCIEDRREADGHSKLVGYALDGFGIFGPHGEGGKPLASADLDECHGHTHKIWWDGKLVEMYHYHGTPDFPYTVGCMRGAYTFRDMMTISGGEGPQPGNRRPNLEAAATKLGITADRLRTALGPPPPDLDAAAAKLGISRDTLMQALQSSGGSPLGSPPRR